MGREGGLPPSRDRSLADPVELSEFDCQCHEKSACGFPCIQCQLDADIRGDAYAHQFTALGGHEDMYIECRYGLIDEEYDDEV